MAKRLPPQDPYVKPEPATQRRVDLLRSALADFYDAVMGGRVQEAIELAERVDNALLRLRRDHTEERQRQAAWRRRLVRWADGRSKDEWLSMLSKVGVLPNTARNWKEWELLGISRPTKAKRVSGADRAPQEGKVIEVFQAVRDSRISPLSPLSPDFEEL